ncbi:hypothetical protein ATCC90586_007039 [Pythium insidiosum]|nr:hypothetical protein ATCC90586_007039 [Pythium insidiosum]
MVDTDKAEDEVVDADAAVAESKQWTATTATTPAKDSVQQVAGEVVEEDEAAAELPERPSTPREIAFVICDWLNEPKVALIHRVVRIAGPDIAWEVLLLTLKVEKEGGELVNAFKSGKPELFLTRSADSTQAQPRRRTRGGLYLTKLKEFVSKEMYDDIFAIEREKRKQDKKMMKIRRHRQMEKIVDELGFDGIQLGGVGSDEETHEERAAVTVVDMEM